MPMPSHRSACTLVNAHLISSVPRTHSVFRREGHRPPHQLREEDQQPIQVLRGADQAVEGRRPRHAKPPPPLHAQSLRGSDQQPSQLLRGADQQSTQLLRGADQAVEDRRPRNAKSPPPLPHQSLRGSDQQPRQLLRGANPKSIQLLRGLDQAVEDWWPRHAKPPPPLPPACFDLIHFKDHVRIVIHWDHHDKALQYFVN